MRVLVACEMSGVVRSAFRVNGHDAYSLDHGETKATCLWPRGLPLLEPTDVVDGRVPRVWLTPGGPRQAMRRSMTYPGIGQAMADQWGAS